MRNKNITDKRVLRSDIPDTMFGVTFKRRFGTEFAFAHNNAKDLFLQCQPYLKIVKSETEKLLHEFRIVVVFRFNKRIEDEGFFELAHTFCLAAIEELNGDIKNLGSNLTINKSYTPIPTVEQIKVAVREAYMMIELEKRARNN